MKKSIRTILYAFLFAALLPSVPRAEAALTLSELDPGTEAAAVLGYADGFIELYNAGGEDACTEGWSVSDRADERKYALPAAAVPAGGYLAVSLSEAGFRAGARESVYLFDPEGAVAGSLSCGDGGFSVSPGGVLRFPSPGRRNGTAYKTAAEVPAFEERGLSISEVSGAGGDWAELYNGTLTEIGLRGCRLWIEGKEYPLSGEIHAGGYLAAENVTVPASGCTVYLLGPGGDILDAFSTGALKYGQSSGRVNGARRFFDTPTKGAANGAGFAAYAPVPVFSDTALYHEAPFSLTLEAGGALIRYTLDGSAVTADSPVYTEPLRIEDGVTVRARAYGEDRLPGDEAAFTYLFTEKHTVPAVCLSMAPRDFKQVYGAEERSEVTERAALCTVYDTDGLVSAAFPCGVKAKGRGSLVFAQKSLTVKLRAKYGQKGAALPYFGTDPVYSFCLRAGGQDIRNAVFRDTLIQRAAAHTHADTVKTVPAVLYVNGAYYGLFMLQEEMNADYYVSHYGVEKEDLDVINQDAGVRQGTLEAYTALRRLARKYTESGRARSRPTPRSAASRENTPSPARALRISPPP